MLSFFSSASLIILSLSSSSSNNDDVATKTGVCQNGGVCVHDKEQNELCNCPEGISGVTCEHHTPVSSNAHPSEVNLLFVVGVSIICVFIIIILIVALFAVRSVKKARATRGTYSPSAQEMFGNSAIEILKPPPEERLI